MKEGYFNVSTPNKVAETNIDFMQHNIKVWHVLGSSIKTCGSFLKYVVAASYIFNK